VLEAAGIKDILSKSLGSSNATNVAKATMLALGQLKNPKEELARRKGIVDKTADKVSSSGEVEAGDEGVV
jgi:small subunit ribosomal protein S5